MSIPIKRSIFIPQIPISKSEYPQLGNLFCRENICKKYNLNSLYLQLDYLLKFMSGPWTITVESFLFQPL